MDFLFNLLPHLVNGLVLGLLFALIALGFMLIVGVMEVINLAQQPVYAVLFALKLLAGLAAISYGLISNWPASIRIALVVAGMAVIFLDTVLGAQA